VWEDSKARNNYLPLFPIRLW